MKYLFQLGRILGFCLLGEVCSRVLPLPVPASIYGLLLLALALKTGLVRLDQVREAGLFLTGIFPLLFVPAAAGVMDLWQVLGQLAVPVLVAVVPVTALVMAASGRATQAAARLCAKRGDRHGGVS